MKITIRAKLIGALFAVALVIAGNSLFQLTSLQHINIAFGDLAHNDLRRLILLQNINLDMLNLYHVVVSGQETDSNIQLSLEAQRTHLQQTSNSVQQEITEYKNLLAGDNQAETKKAISSVAADTEAVLKSSEQLLNSHAASGRIDPSDPVAADLAKQQAALEESFESAITNERIQINEEDKDLQQTVNRDIQEATLGTVLSIVFMLLLGLLFARSILKSIAKLKAGADMVAAGDFSHRIKISSKDELSQLAAAFNQMTDRLQESYRRVVSQNQRDETLLQSLGEGLIALDPKSNVELINGVALGLLEVNDKSKIIGKPVNQILNLKNKENKVVAGDEAPYTVPLATGRSFSDDYGYVRSDKKKTQIHISASPVVVDEQVEGVIMTLRDVTKEKEVDRMKTEFISLASHQLRTPLSAIKWFSEMLLSGDAGKLKPDQADFTKNIADSTERMIQLVNALLNISRIESGRIMVEPQPTDLKELVGGIVNDLKAKTEERSQTLVISVHSDLPKINLDPRLIGQVYLNLLTNAIKYTPKGGEISVLVSKKDNEIISQVTDNGYGIPKEQQDRVFQKFFRATNAVKVETDGTGLGLYLIKSVVESSGGKIWFESEEGKGTTFWFSIPMSGMKRKEGEVTLDV